jgi:hypothetical protein
MNPSVGTCLRFDAGLRNNTNIATNKWDAGSFIVAWFATTCKRPFAPSGRSETDKLSEIVLSVVPPLRGFAHQLAGWPRAIRHR